ncbi:MAG TPA: Crp/Fnr family transcriptional regulator [Puia sp.]|nr:Crp/Fnr family transcriptional regulator [Puia sp.]
MLEPLRQYVNDYVALTDKEFSLLASKITVRNFDKHQRLIQPGEVERYMNFVVRGLVRTYFYKGRAEVVTVLAKERDLISASASFLSGEPSNYFIETLEPTTLLSLTRDDLEELYRTSSRIERLGRLLTMQFVLIKEEWDHEYMRLDTRERFVRFVEKNPGLMQRVPQKYLASYLNMKPETFSRLKHLLKKRPLQGR